MALEKTNPITKFQISLRSPSVDRISGWIRLLNGTKDAGVIYIVDSNPEPPHLSYDYIIMQMLTSQLGNLLTVLQSCGPLQIRLYDPQTTPEDFPVAFLESRGGAGLLGLRASEAELVSKRLGQPQKSTASKTRRK